MKTKHPLKSKTILFIIATFVALVINMAGHREKPLSEMSWGELEQRQERGLEEVVDIMALLGLGGAAYGRVVAKDTIGVKKDD